MASLGFKLGVPGVAQLFGPGRLPGRKGEQAGIVGGCGFGVIGGLAGFAELAEPDARLTGLPELGVAEPVSGACSRMRRA